jgi:hypothetical protein
MTIHISIFKITKYYVDEFRIQGLMWIWSSQPMSLCGMFFCNFGPKHYTNVLLEDMQKLLLSTQQKWNHHQMNGTASKKKGTKGLVEFLESNYQSQQRTRISKTMFSMSIKHGCQRALIVKQPYLDQSFC